MIRNINAISARLSLRSPQRESLEILARAAELLELKKDQDLGEALRRIAAEFPTVADFEREFPSLCFELATGVGKTRLMGAFITYLYQTHGLNNFFVLAPSLTIYEKLIRDFTPNTPKYVFQGIAEFAVSGPAIITGDNYTTQNMPGVALAHPVIINVFNISKINSEVKGGKAPRIKRLSEYIGVSYFDYLASLDDLVLLMDEAHRYRASAGLKAINELKPVLGLELTATARSTGSKSVPFKNVIYSYPLSSALADGFVKEAAALSRHNFDPKQLSKDHLERLMLEDGIHAHEQVKADLQLYALENDKPLVKPFVLVVAQDTTHADQLFRFIRSEEFFGGRYDGRVAVVHSNQSGEAKDEMVQRLLQVEDAKEPTEIVIHVNKLGEGWDVANLFTIVPLRSSASDILTEQTLGRGLRLPYGKRTGVKAIDTLYVSAHDRFVEIIDKAKEPGSIIRRGVTVGVDIPTAKPQVMVVAPIYVPRPPSTADEPKGQHSYTGYPEKDSAAIAQSIATAVGHLPRSANLEDPKVQELVAREATSVYQAGQPTLEGTIEGQPAEDRVLDAVRKAVELTISMPRIVVIPRGDVTSGFHPFQLDLKNIRPQPVDHSILVQYLQSQERTKLIGRPSEVQEDRLENYLVRNLIDFDDIHYDTQSDLLYDLARQVVSHVQSYLASENDVRNVLQYHQKSLSATVHAQMQGHAWEKQDGFEVRISPGTFALKAIAVELRDGEEVRNLHDPITERNALRRMAFNGFRNCLYPVQKFQSYEGELMFARVLEATEGVRWFKPAPKQFQIYYSRDSIYEPDFVVETPTMKLVCEPKSAAEMTDEGVLAKAQAASTWCERATKYELANGGKPWKYVLIPHDAIRENSTLEHLVATYEYRG